MRFKERTKILVVDDEPDLIDIISTELETLGNVAIVKATDGMDAYRKAHNQHFDLICTDFRMPKLNGAKMILALREQKFNQNTPVLVISGYPSEAKDECKANGITQRIEYISKPFESELLLATAQKLLQASTSPTQTSPGK